MEWVGSFVWYSGWSNLNFPQLLHYRCSKPFIGVRITKLSPEKVAHCHCIYWLCFGASPQIDQLAGFANLSIALFRVAFRASWASHMRGQYLPMRDSQLLQEQWVNKDQKQTRFSGWHVWRVYMLSFAHYFAFIISLLWYYVACSRRLKIPQFRPFSKHEILFFIPRFKALIIMFLD